MATTCSQVPVVNIALSATRSQAFCFLPTHMASLPESFWIVNEYGDARSRPLTRIFCFVTNDEMLTQRLMLMSFLIVNLCGTLTYPPSVFRAPVPTAGFVDRPRLTPAWSVPSTPLPDESSAFFLPSFSSNR